MITVVWMKRIRGHIMKMLVDTDGVVQQITMTQMQIMMEYGMIDVFLMILILDTDGDMEIMQIQMIITTDSLRTSENQKGDDNPTVLTSSHPNQPGLEYKWRIVNIKYPTANEGIQ